MATAIRARYRRTHIHLAIARANSDAWLAANLTNPFRDWVAAGDAFTDLAARAAVPTDLADQWFDDWRTF